MKTKQIDHRNVSEDIREHYESQIRMIKENHESKIRLMHENHENLMSYLQKENQTLKTQIELQETEKQELIATHKKKLNEAKLEYENELEKIKELQTISIRNLKREHEEVLDALKKMKANELEAALSATSHTRQIESVLSKIDDNARYLNGISQIIEKNQINGIADAEHNIKQKESQLKSNFI